MQGHILGAHIASSVGKHLKNETGDLIPKIIGLDSASPCFNGRIDLEGLGQGDAQFVKVIHSNCGALGKLDRAGNKYSI